MGPPPIETLNVFLILGGCFYPYEAGLIFLVPPTGHQTYTLTNITKEPYIHSPKTEI